MYIIDFSWFFIFVLEVQSYSPVRFISIPWYPMWDVPVLQLWSYSPSVWILAIGRWGTDMATTGTADTAGAGPSGQVHIWFVGHSRDLLANLVFFFCYYWTCFMPKTTKMDSSKTPSRLLSIPVWLTSCLYRTSKMETTRTFGLFWIRLGQFRGWRKFQIVFNWLDRMKWNQLVTTVPWNRLRLGLGGVSALFWISFQVFTLNFVRPVLYLCFVVVPIVLSIEKKHTTTWLQ